MRRKEIEMASKMVELRHATRCPPTPRTSLLAFILLLASLVGVVGCGVTAGSGASPGSGGSGAPTSTTSSQQSDGNWQTVTEISGSSTSSGGGTNQDISQSSTTVSGAYRVMAACQGSGSLQISLKPGSSLTVHCTAAQQDPIRVAGSDSAPANGILEITVDRQGDIEWSDILVQVRV
jgi:hypothetical protein